MSDSVDPFSKIAPLAASQWGHVTRRQLLAAGMASATISTHLTTGRLIRVHRGVYAVAYRRVEPVARAMAAVLACGAGRGQAVLIHDSALALWNLRRWPDVSEVIAPGPVRRPGIRAHRSLTLTARDVTRQLGVPTTRPARAIVDISPRLTERQRVRLINDARLAHALSSDEAHRLLGHARNPTRSGGEDALQRWFVTHDVPQPLINTIVNGHEVDAVWPGPRLILELDDPATHSDPLTFAADRRHDRDDRELGFETVRLTRSDLTPEEAERVKRILRRRASPPPGPGPRGC